jgi:hypothetical protein
MPCDRAFGDIECKLRKTRCIYTPGEYSKIIRDARNVNKFEVTDMSSEQFLNMTAVSHMMTRRTVTTEKQKVDYRLVSQFRIRRDKPQCVEVRFTHDDSEDWQTISLSKRGRPAKLEDAILKPVLSGSKPIAKVKVDDVRSLLSFIPPVHHEFYDSIVVDKAQANTGVEKSRSI